MTEFTFGITGERAVAEKLDAMPLGLRDRLVPTVRGLMERLRALVVAAEPDRTGRLHAETVAHLEVSEHKIRGRVFVAAEFAKAGALEYGAHRPTKVKAHRATLGHVFARQIAPEAVMVSEHMRTPDIAEHRFLRGPLAALAPEALAEIEAAVDAATR